MDTICLEFSTAEAERFDAAFWAFVDRYHEKLGDAYVKLQSSESDGRATRIIVRDAAAMSAVAWSLYGL